MRLLLEVLNGGGEETRIVGGAVRNALLGLPINDIDLASTATPAVVTARAEAAGLKVVPTGVEHGTVTVVVEGVPFEVTTLREDVETRGRHATVRFGRDFAADARRRDFTINGLSVDRDGTIHDHVGGMADLEARRVAFIGDAAARIREDYLRILRFFRFHAEYGEGPLDPNGFSAAVRERRGLAILSHERVRTELIKLLRARRAVEVLVELSDAGFVQWFLGGVVELGRLGRVAALEATMGVRDGIRRLAAMGVMVAEDAERLRERLRLSNAEHARCAAFAATLARVKSLASPIDGAELRRLVAEFGLEAVTDVAIATEGEPRPIATPEAREALRRYQAGLDPLPNFPVRGRDLLARGAPKGIELGRRLKRAKEAWLAAGCPTGPEAAERFIAVALAEATEGPTRL